MLDPHVLDFLPHFVGNYSLHRLGLYCEAPATGAYQQVDAIYFLG
jgi:hypothetical protein